ncbi:GRIP and coiled-coil domain-containing protein 1-like [Lineus longissimus]|uniref:GRIP and coiled-coil domain-containing protein 1-like n=1 Tax=Lineus longissimus TaxID=88925 RepID=UPI002B4DA882
MDRASRSELLDTIESQREQLQRYEKKLRDLVHAYKSLGKEKEALEATLKCLSAPAKKPPTPQQPKKDSSSNDEDSFVDPLNASGTSEESTDQQDDVQHVRDQLATLMSSLATLTQEKSEMETSFKADKRKIRQETEEKVNKLEHERNQNQQIAQELQDQVLELKAKLISHQYEREKEQNDHGVMMRELQKRISEERLIKESLELQCDELKGKLIEKENMPDISVEYEKKMQKMCQELDAVRTRLKASEEKADQPSPLLLELQGEMVGMKASHRIQVQMEQKRANEAEERVQLVASQSEQRVSGLEAKLSELSEVVGNYERTRLHDQQAIVRLRERVTQLDMENTALARAAHPNNSEFDSDDDSNLDIQALVDKMMKVKGLLKLANERSERPINVEELLKAHASAEDEDEEPHKRCREELLQLKEEFERYKLRAQSVLKNKSSKDLTTTKEVDGVKKQNGELKDRVKLLRYQMEEEETKHQTIVEDMRKSITRMQEKHQDELSNAETEYKKRASALEQQLHKHRDRTIALLVEKDKEIEMLKMGSPVKSLSGDSYSAAILQRSRSTDSQESRDGGLGTEEEVVNSLIQKLTMSSGVQPDGALLHFAHEQARKNVEVNTLRKQKRDLESALRDLQQMTATKEESYQEQIDSLREEIRKHERNKNRESANLEYLKNVVYQYMICSDSVGRKQMLNAIATILQFSPKEKTAVLQMMNSWWGYSPPKGQPQQQTTTRL